MLEVVFQLVAPLAESEPSSNSSKAVWVVFTWIFPRPRVMSEA